MICRDRRALGLVVALGLGLAPGLGGCWLDAPRALAPFECARIDRAAERFPDECGDAGVDVDAGTDAGTDVDAGP